MIKSLYPFFIINACWGHVLPNQSYPVTSSTSGKFLGQMELLMSKFFLFQNCWPSFSSKWEVFTYVSSRTKHWSKLCSWENSEYLKNLSQNLLVLFSFLAAATLQLPRKYENYINIKQSMIILLKSTVYNIRREMHSPK